MILARQGHAHSEQQKMPKRPTSSQKKRKPFQRETPEELLQRDFTGDCYRAALEWASATKGQGWTVVHGTIRNLEVGRLRHAWCERGEEVIDLAMPVGMKKVQTGSLLSSCRAGCHQEIPRRTCRAAVHTEPPLRPLGRMGATARLVADRVGEEAKRFSVKDQEAPFR